MFLKRSIGITKGRNMSGVFVNGYILVYAYQNNVIKESKYVLGKTAPENFEGSALSMGEMLAKNNAFGVESIKGRIRMLQ